MWCVHRPLQTRGGIGNTMILVFARRSRTDYPTSERESASPKGHVGRRREAGDSRS